MFERFTDRARRVVVLAQEEARHLNHSYIGTEHILLGLIHEGDGVAARSLEALDISLEAVRTQVQEIVGHGDEAPTGHIPFTPRAKKVLELSLREAMSLGHNYIGTEHILLGLIREGGGVAAQVLVKEGGSLDRVRQQVIQLLAGYVGGAQPEQVAGMSTRITQQQAMAMVAGGPGAYQEGEPPELVRVVPLAREVFRGYGYRIVLISLELWSGWLDLRYALLPEEAPAATLMPEVDVEWRVSDSAGTAYELAGVASGGGRLLRVHQLTFSPAVSEDARGLTLRAVDREGNQLVVIEIDLVAGD
ncbi:MAG: clpC3 [Actinomycetia bacterium]|nr:clpC3 [Actinomycetes bacterium]